MRHKGRHGFIIPRFTFRNHPDADEDFLPGFIPANVQIRMSRIVSIIRFAAKNIDTAC